MAVPLSLDMQYRHPDQADTRLLGAVRYGIAAPVAETTELGVPLRCLTGAPTCWTSWLGQNVSGQGSIGPVRYRHDEQMLFGCLQLRESDFAGQADSPLQAATRTAYQALFQTMRQTGFVHLVRCWNYLPDINADGGGLERYRQFNIGRQEAFVAEQHGWQGGAPAASALGSHSGDLSIYFLASRTAATPLENPRQTPAYRYPSEYGPRSPIFSRGALLTLPDSETLFISGTASIVGHASVHHGDLTAQTEETLRNIAAVVNAANAKAVSRPFTPEELALKVFVRHAEDQPRIEQILTRHLGASEHTLFLHADVCRAELLVEIEAFCSHDKEHA